MRRSSHVVVPAAALLAAGWLPSVRSASAGEADFKIVDQSVAVDLAHQTAQFTLTFDRAPDFSAGQDGQATAFQYEIDVNHTSLQAPLPLDDISSVVRGGELWEGHGLPVRQRDGDGGTNGGGWGPIRALLPYQLQDKTITFSADLSALGDTDGKFRYRVMAMQDGSVTSEAQGAAIPLPPAIWTGLSLLGGTGLVGILRKKRMA